MNERETKTGGRWASLTKRTLPAIVAILILLASLYFGGYVYIAVLMFVSVNAMYEIYAAFGALPDVKPIVLPGYIYIGLMVPAWYFFGPAGLLSLFILCLCTVFIIRIIVKNHSTKDVIFSAFALIYPALLLSLLLILVKRDLTRFFLPLDQRGITLITMLSTFIIAVFTDTFAYLVGMAVGRHKLIPDISPKKTVEGAVGGLIGSMGGMLLVYFFVQQITGFFFPVYHFLIVGLIASFAAQVGDLAASLIKRYAGIKDFGRIMPGHGGAMDRMDSIIFVAPVVIGYCALFLVPGGIA
jgi:phosphatidate cytidylyltransferase